MTLLDSIPKIRQFCRGVRIENIFRDLNLKCLRLWAPNQNANESRYSLPPLLQRPACDSVCLYEKNRKIRNRKTLVFLSFVTVFLYGDWPSRNNFHGLAENKRLKRRYSVFRANFTSVPESFEILEGLSNHGKSRELSQSTSVQRKSFLW